MKLSGIACVYISRLWMESIDVDWSTVAAPALLPLLLLQCFMIQNFFFVLGK